MTSTTDARGHRVARTAEATARATFHWWQRWPEWVAPATIAWSLLYGALGVWWTLGGRGFPFGIEHDPDAEASTLMNVTADVGAPVIAVLSLLGALAAAALAQTGRRSRLHTLSLAFAWSATVALLLVVPDYRALIRVAYAPIVLLGYPFDFPPGVRDVTFGEFLPWPVINQFLCIAGGLLFGATALAYQRRTQDARASFGRTSTVTGWTSPESAARWGRWATYIAAGLPLLYAVTRWAWALGIPLGVTEEFLRDGERDAPGIWWAGAALATLAVGGGVLTLGLIQRWGEVFPRWTLGLAGKRVPPAVAIIPAGLVAILVTEAGLMFVRLTLNGTFDEEFSGGNWATVGPELTWPVWGVALGLATLAYYFRRRGQCAACGRGAPETTPGQSLAAHAQSATGGWTLGPSAGPHRAATDATRISPSALIRRIVLVALAVLSGVTAGLVALLGAAVATARPMFFLAAGLTAFCVVYLLLLRLATRDIAPARRQRLRTLLFGVGTVAVVGAFAATALPPLDDPRLLPAPVSGQQFWQLPTGSKIAYVRVTAAGHPHPTPVIFLHGGPGVSDMVGDSRYFGNLARDGFDVYIYDQVGTGRSSRLADPRGYTLERDVADLEEIRRTIGAERMILIGHSNGGMIAAAYAAVHGQHVAAMVLSSPGDPSPSAGGMSMRSRLSTKDELRLYALLLHPRPLLAYALLQVNPDAARAFASDAELDARQDRVYNRTRPALHCRGKPPGPELHGLGFFDNQYPQSAASQPHADFLPDLAGRTIPTLIIKGRCDYLSWSSALAYLRALPDARLIYLDGSGHNAYQDEPERYMAAVRAFLFLSPLPEPLYEEWHMPDGYEGPP